MSAPQLTRRAIPRRGAMLAIAVIVGVLAAGSAAASAQARPTGSLSVRVSGVPHGARASVTVLGPRRYVHVLSVSTTMRRLRPGRYLVVAGSFSVAFGQAYVVPGPQRATVTVVARRTRAVSVSYRLVSRTSQPVPPPPPAPPVKPASAPCVRAGSGGSGSPPPAGYEMAFQANTGDMFEFGSGGSADLRQGMMACTSPAIAALAGGGFEMAFQANTGNLIVFGSGGNINTGQGMKAGTSPAIAASPRGGFEVAFQANNGGLYIYNSQTGPANLQQGMDNDTSPSIAALPGGGYEVAFQANTGNLIAYGSAGNVNTGQGMMPGTSPAIAASPADGYQAAFEANNGNLYIYNSQTGPANLQQGMNNTTSPSIAALPGGGYEMAFQANTGNLIAFGSAGNVNTGQGMMPGTSPAIAASPAGGYQAAFEANNGNLYVYNSQSGPANLGQGMDNATSPAITTLGSGGGGAGSGGGQGQAIVQNAAKWNGTPYCWAGGTFTGPTPGGRDKYNGLQCGVGGYEPPGTVGFDCTGLTLYAVYQATGGAIRLSHGGSQAYSAPGQVIANQAALQPGDIVYFGGTLGNFVHAGVYAGVVNGKPSFWSAVTEYTGVKLLPMSAETSLGFVGAVRFWH